jgi:uncharacterized SAM-binding protein YcdF (DUF218 family)
MEWSALKSLFSVLVLPPAGPLVLAALGWWLSRRRQPARARAGRALLGSGLAAAWLLSTPAVAEALIGWVESFSPDPITAEALARELRGPSPPGAIVVLGGGVRHNEREWPHADWPNPRTLERLAFGALLSRASGLPILVSGGTPRRRETSEAALMARTLEGSFGLSPRWLDEQARDTAGNAAESARLLAADGVGRVVLVTQAYHMPRALAAFRAAGLDPIAAPHGFSGGSKIESWHAFLPSASATGLSWLATHEAIGVVWYRIRGYF